jgi:hypothetical protein
MSTDTSLLTEQPLKPGYPNSATADGYGSMMEVGYVAHYVT